MSNENKITVLGKTFNSEEERRTYFREELRKKLPELKKMEGFPIGEDEDILNLSDPPYYTACPNPWLNDFIAEWEAEKKELEKQGLRKADFEVNEPYAADVSEGKYSAIYKFHPYPTKVPHMAIMRYILHYTQPGDIVFDGFSGTGMTGVAAQLCGNKEELISLEKKGENNIFSENKEESKNTIAIGARKSILNDLSTIAGFISYNYNTPDYSENMLYETELLIRDLESEFGWMFETIHPKSEKKGTINYMLWSDVFICSNCQREVIFWEVFADSKTGEIHEKANCPNCQSLISKRNLDKSWETFFDPFINSSIKTVKQVPILINYTFNKKRFSKKVDSFDLELINRINKLKFNEWVPTDSLPNGDKTNEPKNRGILNAHHFYTRRNLIILSLFNSKISDAKQKLFITKLANQINKMYRFTYMSGVWGAGGGPMAGTLYIPSLSKELSVIKQLRTALKQRAGVRLRTKLGNYIGNTGSFSSALKLANESIDYIFIDPPFGHNLNYSELSFLWESWLGCKTNIFQEAIVSRAQKKGISEYKELMSLAFRQAFRILKPGKWMTVEFSNTSASIWNTIQSSLTTSGFIVANVSALDKKKGTFNAQSNPTSVKQDLVISCYKPSSEFNDRFENKKNSHLGIWEFVSEHLNKLPIHLISGNSTTSIIERSPKILFDRLIGFYVQRGLPVPIDAGKFQQGLPEQFIERDGMFFTNEQVQDYDRKKAEVPNFVQMSIFVANEQDAIYWLRRILEKESKTEQDLHPLWMKEVAGNMRKGDTLPEMRTILEENFLKNDKGQWYLPDPENKADLEKLRTKRLIKQFEIYKTEGYKPKGKIKEARVEALRAGFKQCYQDKNFKTIVQIGDRIPNNLLMEDEVLLQFYDIASSKV